MKTPTTPSLIMIVGLPGTGKTTFARALCELIGGVHLNSDMIREQLGLRGHYTPQDKDRVYRELHVRAADQLCSRQVVIVDATLYRESLRLPYRRLAEEMGCPLHWLEMQADPAVVQQRTARTRRYSEADFAVYEKIKATYEPLVDEHLVLDTEALSPVEMLPLAEAFVTREMTTK